MDKKRFTIMKKFDGSYVICNNGKMLVADDCCELLNEQQTEIDDLKKENERLQKELDNFKPVMFQDMRKGTIILYSKG